MSAYGPGVAPPASVYWKRWEAEGLYAADRITRIPPNQGSTARHLLVLNSSVCPPPLDGLAEPQVDACTATLEAKHVDHFS